MSNSSLHELGLIIESCYKEPFFEQEHLLNLKERCRVDQEQIILEMLSFYFPFGNRDIYFSTLKPPQISLVSIQGCGNDLFKIYLLANFTLHKSPPRITKKAYSSFPCHSNNRELFLFAFGQEYHSHSLFEDSNSRSSKKLNFDLKDINTYVNLLNNISSKFCELILVS